MECFRKYNCTKLHVDKKRASLKKILSSLLAKRKKWVRCTIWIPFQRLLFPTNQRYGPEGRIGCASSLCISFIVTFFTAGCQGRPVPGDGFSVEPGHWWEDLCQHVGHSLRDSDLCKRKPWYLALAFAVMMQFCPFAYLYYTMSVLEAH